MWDPTSVGEENETFFIWVWKPLPSICILKALRGSPKESPKRTISASGGLGLLQMISKPDTGQCANEEAEPWRGRTQGDMPARTLGLEGGGLGGLTSIGEWNECQRGHWALNKSGMWDPTSVKKENKTLFIRVWKPLPSRRVLKIERENSKRTISTSGGLRPLQNR